MPENTVYVGRPTLWGNPWAVTEGRMTLIHTPNGAGKVVLPSTAILSKTPADAVKRYRAWVNGTIFGWRYVTMFPVEEWRKELVQRLPELRGKNLSCWCKEGDCCHADVLLELANVP